MVVMVRSDPKKSDLKMTQMMILPSMPLDPLDSPCKQNPEIMMMVMAEIMIRIIDKDDDKDKDNADE